MWPQLQKLKVSLKNKKHRTFNNLWFYQAVFENTQRIKRKLVQKVSGSTEGSIFQNNNYLHIHLFFIGEQFQKANGFYTSRIQAKSEFSKWEITLIVESMLLIPCGCIIVILCQIFLITPLNFDFFNLLVLCYCHSYPPFFSSCPFLPFKGFLWSVHLISTGSMP